MQRLKVEKKVSQHMQRVLVFIFTLLLHSFTSTTQISPFENSSMYYTVHRRFRFSIHIFPFFLFYLNVFVCFFALIERTTTVCSSAKIAFLLAFEHHQHWRQHSNMFCLFSLHTLHTHISAYARHQSKSIN